MKLTLKRAVMGVAVAASFSLSANASADLLGGAISLLPPEILGISPPDTNIASMNFDFNGLFTMLDPSGTLVTNSSTAPESTWWYGKRSLMSGTMSFNLTTLSGTGTVNDFQFFGDSPAHLAHAHDITMQMIGDGNGGVGTLILANMGFDWNGTTGIPVSLVMDAAGMFANLPSMVLGSTIGCANTSTMVGDPQNPAGAPCDTFGGATAASNLSAQEKNKLGLLTFDGRMGTLPAVTTTWNTSTIAGAGMGSNVSGELPLIADTIGGSPMIAGPFAGFNANFEITQLTLSSYTLLDNGTPTPTPIPAAAWLLGSGLMGLVGVARRRKLPV